MSTLTITLDPAVEKKAKRQAQKLRVSLEEFVGNVVKVALDAESESYANQDNKPIMGREILDELRQSGALFRTDMTEDTVEYAHKLRERSQRRNLR